MEIHLVLGNQLFEPRIVEDILGHGKRVHVFMREDLELCTYFRFHKHKILFFLGAMRAYAKECREAGWKVHYETLHKSERTYEAHLLSYLKEIKASEISVFEIEDKFFEKRVFSTLEKAGIAVRVLPSPMFLCDRASFADYLQGSKRPFMKTFYEQQRKRLGILLDSKGGPEGGQWSFDQENRQALPKDLRPPKPSLASPDLLPADLRKSCEEHFPHHPGEINDFWLPVDRAGARAWLEEFLMERLAQFGPFEDAIPAHSDFVFHSVLTPFLNVGLLTPFEAIEAVLATARTKKIPLASLEGFIRQVIGWREFIRGIYQNFSERQDQENFWRHKGKLNQHWYLGTTGIPPLDNAIRKANQFAYAHHIERLMVIGNLMLLLEIDPREAHRWFMEMFVDSSDWVMGPNVYGMALFSDGGIFATKPYICGSNYLRKMGGYRSDEWCDGVDGLYWGFIERHKNFFLKNPRLAMIARTIEKMDPAKKKKIFAAADDLRARLVD